MMSVEKNKLLQQISNKAVRLLMNLRDKEASIPQWAAADPLRVELFKKYGSSSVFSFFNPHFSIFDPIHLDSRQKNQLKRQLSTLIRQFSMQFNLKKTAKVEALAVGIANKQGQIIKELATFHLLG